MPHPLESEQGFNVSATVCDTEDHHVVVYDAIDDDIIVDGKAPKATPEFAVSAAAQVRMIGQQEKSRVIAVIWRSAIATLPLSVAM